MDKLALDKIAEEDIDGGLSDSSDRPVSMAKRERNVSAMKSFKIKKK